MANFSFEGCSDVELTKEQEEFLKEAEEEFKDRYTTADPDFKAVAERKPSPPPVFLGWNDIRPCNRDRRSYT